MVLTEADVGAEVEVESCTGVEPVMDVDVVLDIRDGTVSRFCSIRMAGMCCHVSHETGEYSPGLISATSVGLVILDHNANNGCDQDHHNHCKSGNDPALVLRDP